MNQQQLYVAKVPIFFVRWKNGIPLGNFDSNKNQNDNIPDLKNMKKSLWVCQRTPTLKPPKTKKTSKIRPFSSGFTGWFERWPFLFRRHQKDSNFFGEKVPMVEAFFGSNKKLSLKQIETSTSSTKKGDAKKSGWYWMWPPHSNSGKWRFIGVPY